MTTVVLIAGFSTVVFSGMRDQRIFATMGGLTLVAALFGDLILLPGLLLRFAPRRSSRIAGLAASHGLGTEDSD